jgi:hypothetical protein
MKYWKQHLNLDTNRQITVEELMNNRNLRRFKKIRTFFLVFNPMVAVVLLSMFFTGVI